jgi:hypothetical protein
MLKNERCFLFAIFFLGFFASFVCLAMDDELDFDLSDEVDWSEIAQEEISKQNLRVWGGLTGAETGVLVGALRMAMKEPLWKHTKSPKGRDVLYLLPHKITAIEYGGIGLSLFLNVTSNMGVKAGNLFEVDISTDKAAVTALLSTKFKSVSELTRILPLMKKITLQERKVGGLIQGGFVRGPFSVQLNTSIQLSERNFWLSKKDQKELKEAFVDMLGRSSTLDKKELYRIKCGFGDTRLKFNMNTLNMSNFQVDFGVEGIFPTSRFAPKLKLEKKEELSVSQLMSLRDYLLNPQLGNGGHWGAGCFLETKIGLFGNKAQLWSRMSFDKLFANEESRLIMHRKTMLPGDLNPTGSNMDQFINEYLFPNSFKVMVYPGGIFNFITSCTTDIKKWQLAAGYDFFLQKEELIKKLQNTNVNLNELRIEDAQAQRSLQHKIFGEVCHVKNFKRSTLRVGIGGDKTIDATRMGKDWTVYFKIAASF